MSATSCLPTEIDDEETFTLVSNPSPCGPASADGSDIEGDRVGGSSPHIHTPCPWAIRVPPSDLPAAPNVYHVAHFELANADAVWWHQDTICIRTLDAQALSLFWDHTKLGMPPWWERGPSSKEMYKSHSGHVVMRKWVGPAAWAPVNTMGEVMEARFED